MTVSFDAFIYFIAKNVSNNFFPDIYYLVYSFISYANHSNIFAEGI